VHKKDLLLNYGVSVEEIIKINYLDINNNYNLTKCKIILKTSKNKDELICNLLGFIIEDCNNKIAYDKKLTSKLLSCSTRKIDELRKKGLLNAVNLSFEGYEKKEGRKTLVYTDEAIFNCLNLLEEGSLK
jgi:hypothetical protein